MTYKRTDLALEETEMCKTSTQKQSDIDGIQISEKNHDELKITKVEVLNENGAKKISKPVGNYITIEAESLDYESREMYVRLCESLKSELDGIFCVDLSKPVLVVGLGNRNITADALGPKVVEQMLVTRHLFEQMPSLIGEDTTSVCAIAPGVLGITGIETMEIVKGVCERVKPGLVIAVDALAARKIQRINTTIQISDAGINPGSGVGNNRKALSRDTLGVDVIAIGVPTVVDAVTMANDTLDMTIDAIKNNGKDMGEAFSFIDELCDEEKYNLIQQLLMPTVADMVLTVKEVDLAMDKISKIIAGGINTFLQKSMTIEDVENFTI